MTNTTSGAYLVQNPCALVISGPISFWSITASQAIIVPALGTYINWTEIKN